MPETWTGKLIGRMHNNGITYDALASEIGVTKAYVSMILNGKRKPDGARKRMESAVGIIIDRSKQEEFLKPDVKEVNN